MLYDPRWDQQTKAVPYSLEDLIAWLEKQPAKKSYCWRDARTCLLGQYAAAIGQRLPLYSIPIHLAGVVLQEPLTFGAALDRARRLTAA